MEVLLPGEEGFVDDWCQSRMRGGDDGNLEGEGGNGVGFGVNMWVMMVVWSLGVLLLMILSAIKIVDELWEMKEKRTM